MKRNSRPEVYFLFIFVPMNELSHINASGESKMVSVHDKQATKRFAQAEAQVIFPKDVWEKLSETNFQISKGNLINTAVLAGIMAAKKTGELIPLCHPLMLDHVDVSIQAEEMGFKVTSEARLTGKTGVEMEALTACSVGALTIYDMCKALSHEIEIKHVRLLQKTGGKSDYVR
ncbi:MAG: cyclic pyranopterin monophosphate synthase MoaC [Flavobacteriales bacterium]